MREREPVRRRHATPEPPWEERREATAAVLALQRSAGNQSVARAIAAQRMLARWEVIKPATNDGREEVRQQPGDPQPSVALGSGKFATQPFDGYEYELVGNDKGLIYRRRLRSHQGAPQRPPSKPTKTTSYGTFPLDTTGGGVVTPNPSAHFPQQAALDYATYAMNVQNPVTLPELITKGYSGAGRMIDGSDVESLLDQLQGGVDKLAKDVGGEVKVVGASLASKLRALFLGGDGTTMVEEREVRERLQDVTDDPRVIHYLLLHSRGNLSRTGISFVLSKLSLGVTATVEKIGSGIAIGGLDKALLDLVKALEDENGQVTSSDQRKPHPDELMGAIGGLAKHYGASMVVEFLKAIPLYVGTGVGLAQTASRSLLGTIDDPKAACTIIRRYLVLGNSGAVRIVKLLGVPEEVVMARGGEKVLMARL